MPRSRDPVPAHDGQILDLDFAPFEIGDWDALSREVLSIAVSRARFCELIDDLNRACRRWKLERRSEVRPTDRQEAAFHEQLHARIGAVLALLHADDDMMPEMPASEEPQRLPSLAPHDEEHVRMMRELDLDGRSLGLPDDPSALSDGSLPWCLERVRNHFERVYSAGSAPSDVLRAGEALLELPVVLGALKTACAAHASELIGGADRPGAQSRAASANRLLFTDLVTIYGELFGRPIARSNPSDGKSSPGGPAIRFCHFVFDRLQTADAPTDKTLSTWIQQQRRGTWLSDGRE